MIFSLNRGSNTRPFAYKANALPLSFEAKIYIKNLINFLCIFLKNNS